MNIHPAVGVKKKTSLSNSETASLIGLGASHY